MPTELESALDLYGKRAGSDLLEGIRLHDNNYPLDPDPNRRDIIVVSESEFYSVLATDIVDSDGAAQGHPQRIWVRDGADVWRCQKMKLEVEAAVKHKELSSAIDEHLATRFDLSRLNEVLATAPAVAPTLECGKVLRGSRLPTDVAIKSVVLRAIGRTDLDPQQTGGDTTLSNLGYRGSIWALALKIQQEFEPFRTHQLWMQFRYVNAKVHTLGDFVTCIKCCYKPPHDEANP